MRKRLVFALAALVGLVASGVTASAHHSFAAEYDWKKPLTLTGTVSRIGWMNPHVLLTVDGRSDIKDDKEAGAWTMEMGSPSALSRFGWSRDTLKPGDRITVDAWRAKDGSRRGNARSVTLSSGRELNAASSFFASTFTGAAGQSDNAKPPTGANEAPATKR